MEINMFYGILALFFILIGSFTILNMLIGILTNI